MKTTRKIKTTKWYVIQSPCGGWEPEEIVEYSTKRAAVSYAQMLLCTNARPTKCGSGWYDLVTHNNDGTESNEIGICRGDKLERQGYHLNENRKSLQTDDAMIAAEMWGSED